MDLDINFGPYVAFRAIVTVLTSIVARAHADLLLGSKVILNMLDVVKQPQSHNVFFDDLFTGYDLLVHL